MESLPQSDDPGFIARASTALDELLQAGGLVAAIAILPAAAIRFLRDQCIQWAAALAYYTLIGLVPLLLAVFSLVKGLGLHRGLAPFVMGTVGAGSPEMSAQIVQYIDQAQVRAVGLLSAVAALLAVFGILGNAELCLNTIWGRVRGRPIGRKVRSYLAVAAGGPLLLLVALAVTAFFRRGAPGYVALETWYLAEVVRTTLRVLPFALLWVGFTLFYLLIPNTDVRPSSAVVGAVVAGTIWQLGQWAYVTFMIALVRYGGIYGALWQLPILLAWVYIAWVITLFGAEVCHAHAQVAGGPASRRSAAPRTPGTGHAE